MTTIIDLRKKCAPQTLTFADLKAGEWFEYVNDSDAIGRPNGPRMKKDQCSCLTPVPSQYGHFYGLPVAHALVRRLDVEIVIKGEKA